MIQSLKNDQVLHLRTDQIVGFQSYYYFTLYDELHTIFDPAHSFLIELQSEYYINFITVLCVVYRLHGIKITDNNNYLKSFFSL